MTPAKDIPPLIPLDDVQAVLSQLPHYRELGLAVVEIARGKGILRLDYHPRLVGDFEHGLLHGGVITTLMDSVCGMVAFSVVPEGTAAATLDLRIDYLRPAGPGKPVFGFAECYRITRSVAFVRGCAYHETADDPLATCAGTFMIGSVGFSVSSKGSA